MSFSGYEFLTDKDRARARNANAKVDWQKVTAFNTGYYLMNKYRKGDCRAREYVIYRLEDLGMDSVIGVLTGGDIIGAEECFNRELMKRWRK